MFAESFFEQFATCQDQTGEGAQVFVSRAGGPPETVQSVEIDEDGDIVIHID